MLTSKILGFDLQNLSMILSEWGDNDRLGSIVVVVIVMDRTRSNSGAVPKTFCTLFVTPNFCIFCRMILKNRPKIRILKNKIRPPFSIINPSPLTSRIEPNEHI